MKKSKRVGKNTSEVEVTHISLGGLWLLLNDKEFFLPFEKFPWFRNATVAEIHNVKTANNGHLRWPDLDIDLDTDSIEDPENSPLIAS